MMFLLDTNAFSDLMRKHPGFISRLSTLAPTDRVVICPIVRGEIRYGIEQLSPGRRKQDLEKQAAPLFATITCEPIMASAADHYATVKITMRRKGLALDENDLWIAATALAMGAALITRDNDVNRSKVFQYRTGRHNLSRSKKAQTDPFNRTSLRIRPVIKLSTTITTTPIPSTSSPMFRSFPPPGDAGRGGDLLGCGDGDEARE